MASKRYIVVGAGLAGCLLAWRLEQAGQNVCLIGSTRLHGASEVAGGIINPVTGRWMTKSWRFDTCIQQATKTYHELENRFNIHCYHPTSFIRYCQNEADVKRIRKRLRNPRYANVLGKYISATENGNMLTDTYGSFFVKQGAYVELPLLLQTLRNHFAKQGTFLDETFVHGDLVKENSKWHYHNLKADDVIFCEGVRMQENMWFKQLPLKPVKGETLIFQCDTLQLPRRIYHRSKWLLPIEENHFRIGATYNDNDLSEKPTESGKEELLTSVQSFLALPQTINIKQHNAGLRPCTKDFRPFIGSHPTYSGLHIFNGLGSKGTLLAPEMIRQFIAYLLKDETLDEAIDCKRFIT